MVNDKNAHWSMTRMSDTKVELEPFIGKDDFHAKDRKRLHHMDLRSEKRPRQLE